MNENDIIQQLAKSRIQINGEEMEVLGPIMTYNLAKHYSELLIEGVGTVIAGEQKDFNRYQSRLDELDDEIKRVMGALEMIREDRIKKNSSAAAANLEDIGHVIEYLQSTIYPDVLALLLISKGVSEDAIYNTIAKTIEALNKADVDQKDMSKAEIRSRANSLLKHYLLKFRALGKIYYDSFMNHHHSLSPSEVIDQEEAVLEKRIKQLVNDAARPLVYVTHFLKIAENAVASRVQTTGIDPDNILQDIIEPNPHLDTTVN